MTEYTFTVSGTDVFPGGIARPAALARYMQLVAGKDCDSHGASYADMRAHDCVFVLSKLAMHFHCPICSGDTITLRTFNNRINGIYFEREFEFFRGGSEVAHATTLWALISYSARVPLRPRTLFAPIPEENRPTATLDVPHSIDTKGVLPCGERVARLSDLDENDHINNCVYFDIAADSTDFDGKTEMITDFYMLYRREARRGDVIELSALHEGNTYTVSGRNETTAHPCFDAFFTVEKL